MQRVLAAAIGVKPPALPWPTARGVILQSLWDFKWCASGFRSGVAGRIFISAFGKLGFGSFLVFWPGFSLDSMQQSYRLAKIEANAIRQKTNGGSGARDTLTQKGRVDNI